MKPVSPFPERIVLIGAGKMGGALQECWLKAGIHRKAIMVVDNALPATLPLESIQSLPECVVLAVKPQSLKELLPLVAEKFGTSPLYISIAAGKTVHFFEEFLGSQAAIVRAMPNTPALIGKGTTAIFANSNADARQKTIAKALFKAAGETVWLKDEALMDAVTAISGSGPAYVFLILESLTAAGIAQGLGEFTARKLAIETLIGSAELAKSSEESLAALRENVTSKGGTTQAALSVLMKDDALKNMLVEAVAQAVKRASELAEEK